MEALPGAIQKDLNLDDLAMLEEVIGQGANRILALTQSLAVFSRRDGAEGGAPVDLRRCIRSVLAMAVPPDGIDVTADLADVAPVFGSEGEIALVISNLLANAYQAIGSAGTVAVRLRQMGDQAEISISDTGPGLSEEAKAHLFEPFFTTKGGRGEVGLGLHLSRQVVERHGGEIEIVGGVVGGAVASVRLTTVAGSTPS